MTIIVVYAIQLSIMKQLIDTKDIPEVISLTDLRYKTGLLLRKIVDEEKPLILVKKSKRIALILPLEEGWGKKEPRQALKVRAYPLGAPRRIKRSLVYDDYLDEKIGN